MHGRSIQVLLLGYVLVVIGVLTLSPFRFAFPEQWVVSVWGDAGDLPHNVALFLPLGFLFRMMLRDEQRGTVAVTTLLGGAVSLAIETSQLFLADRLSSLLDVIGNALGAAAGGALLDALRRLSDRRLPGVLLLDLPLVNILYLLLPLMWLAATGVAADRLHPWVLLPLGVTGALTLAGLWRFRLHRMLRHPRAQLLLIVGVWLGIGAIAGSRSAPFIVTVCAGLALLLGALPTCMAGPHRGPERRFEGEVLARLWPVYLCYVCLITAGMPPRLGGAFEVTWLYPVEAFDRNFTLRIVEQLGALTLLGYLIGESLGRRSGPPRSGLAGCLLAGAACAAVIEAAHGLRMDDQASALRGMLGVTACWFGSALYTAQFDLVRLLIQTPRGSRPRPAAEARA